jgi:hypothetical protein
VSLRWNDYVLARSDDVVAAWAEASKNGRTVYIVGEGFDPRALLGLERLLAADVTRDLAVISIELAPPGSTSVRAGLVAQHVARLEELAATGAFAYERIPFPAAVHEPRSVGRLVFGALYGLERFRQARHVIVDISAIPTGVYFAVIAGILDMVAENYWEGELQVVVAENAAIDSRIHGAGTDAPAPISRFKFDIELDPRADRPVIVWAPVLGEGALPQLEAIQQALVPDEVCPILPFPARNPRRSDDLLVVLRGFLIDAVGVDPGNYIYADESNPLRPVPWAEPPSLAIS